ncbi:MULTISPECIES: hypothetical protein [Streptomyces]|uniref:hypothetical protein n=1 Tax=Streptomyces TaxID=1883 RepID=UPI0016767F29|nr:hypothetical protein [Streptomyces galilaeus]GGW50940.1 hypothetical protein GCM10010350_39140 [Streptomyces galilaeus]
MTIIVRGPARERSRVLANAPELSRDEGHGADGLAPAEQRTAHFGQLSSTPRLAGPS